MTLSTSTTEPVFVGEIDLSQVPDDPKHMTFEQKMLVLDVLNARPEEYMGRFLYIKDKNGDLVKLKLNRIQHDILMVMKHDWERGVPVRILVLKARQGGVSTFVEALFFSLTVNNPRRNTWIITHEVKASENLFEMSELYLDSLDEEVSPMVRNRDKKNIRFDNPDPVARKVNPGLRSRIYIEQAKKVDAGRSATIDYLHISERAFWPTSKTAVSLLQAVSKSPHTIVVQETTANGVHDAGGFYDLWTDNYGKPNGAWRCLFFPWFILDEYVHDPSYVGTLDADGRLVLQVDPDGEMREDGLREGIEYINVWGERETWCLTDEQIAFRRWAIDEKCEGSVFTFMQEYPSTPQEAFVQSGKPWWNRAGMEHVRTTLTPPIARGFLCSKRVVPSAGSADTFREDHYHPREMRKGQVEVKFVDDDTGGWWIWRHPEEGREYLTSQDTAEGGEGGDFAVIQVFDRHTLEQVAEYHARTDTDLLAHQAAMACFYYNKARAIPEVNNTGYGFMAVFKNLWGNIYLRRNPDAALNSHAEQWVQGFRTDGATRPLLVTRGANFIREKIPTIHSTRLYDEMVSFVKDSKGVPRAAGKGHDDLVMAFLLILELWESRPVKLDKERRAVTLDDDKSFKAHKARRRGRSQGEKLRFRG